FHRSGTGVGQLRLLQAASKLEETGILTLSKAPPGSRLSLSLSEGSASRARKAHSPFGDKSFTVLMVLVQSGSWTISGLLKFMVANTSLQFSQRSCLARRFLSERQQGCHLSRRTTGYEPIVALTIVSPLKHSLSTMATSQHAAETLSRA